MLRSTLGQLLAGPLQHEPAARESPAGTCAVAGRSVEEALELHENCGLEDFVRQVCWHYLLERAGERAAKAEEVQHTDIIADGIYFERFTSAEQFVPFDMFYASRLKPEI